MSMIDSKIRNIALIGVVFVFAIGVYNIFRNQARPAIPSAINILAASDEGSCAHTGEWTVIDPNAETVMSSGNCSKCGATIRPTKVGDIGPGGGRIFYIDLNGFTVEGFGSPGDENYFASYTARFLEAAPEDVGRHTLWEGRDNPADRRLDVLGRGRRNTADILSRNPNVPAVRASADYRGPNNLDDWFLPSSDELWKLYHASCRETSAGRYWTSTVLYERGQDRAYFLDFGARYAPFDNAGSGFAYNVRPIRAWGGGVSTAHNNAATENVSDVAKIAATETIEIDTTTAQP